MTLCIAAQCLHKGRPALVVCADMQGTDFAKSSDTYKISANDKAFTTYMFCDVVSAAKELIREIDRKIESHMLVPRFDDVSVSQVIADIKSLTHEKLRLAKADYIGRQYGLTPTEFYSVANDAMREAARAVSLDCELLICHAANDLSMIIHVDALGVPSWHEKYIAIGSGGYIARAFLAQQDWVNDLTIVAAAGRIYAAKLAAQKDVHVSDATQLFFLRPGKPMTALSVTGKAKVDAARPRLSIFHDAEALDLEDEDFDESSNQIISR